MKKYVAAGDRLIPLADVFGIRSSVLYVGGESVAVNEAPASLGGNIVAGVQ